MGDSGVEQCTEPAVEGPNLGESLTYAVCGEVANMQQPNIVCGTNHGSLVDRFTCGLSPGGWMEWG